MRLELTFHSHWSKPRIESYADGWNHAYFGIGYFAWKRAWKPLEPSSQDSYPVPGPCPNCPCCPCAGALPHEGECTDWCQS